jgi:hypothetical protein
VYLEKMIIAWLKMMMIPFLMVAIHMKTNEDDDNVDQEVGEGIL